MRFLSLFLNNFLRIYYSSFPLIRVKNKTNQNSWIKPGIITSCKHKRELCKTESLGALACRRGHRSRRYRRLSHVEEECASQPLFAEVPGGSFNEAASCKDLLCRNLNPNCSSRISLRSLTSCNIPANRIFSNNLPIVSKRQMCRQDEGSSGSFPGLRIEINRACFHTVGT